MTLEEYKKSGLVLNEFNRYLRSYNTNANNMASKSLMRKFYHGCPQSALKNILDKYSVFWGDTSFFIGTYTRDSNGCVIKVDGYYKEDYCKVIELLNTVIKLRGRWFIEDEDTRFLFILDNFINR